MPGERVIVIDNSATVQELCKAILEDHGYRVSIAGNGLAALTHPEVESCDLIMVDSSLEGIGGLETTRQIKTDRETYKIPVLLMIPQDSVDLLENVPLKGATGWISKPFSPAKLVAKVREVLEEQRVRAMSEEYLREAAETHMQALAEQKIQRAVEKKIQIIVERAIQSIVSIIDQRARKEVEARVTALTAEKEQELVKMTVQEVARSMVEKLADRKVSEAINAMLVETTEKTVKRAADGLLPGLVRDRIKEQIDNILPREVETRVNKASEERAAEVGEQLVTIIQQQSQKMVPVIARESLPELAERQMMQVAEGKLPKLISDSAHTAMSNEMNQTVRPFVDAEMLRMRKRSNKSIVLATVILFAFQIAIFLFACFFFLQAKQAIEEESSSRLQAPASPVAEVVHTA